jgi:hypothetical protein
VGPARIAWDPEDARGFVLVGVFGVGAFSGGGRGQLGVLGLERVADVLEEDEPKDDVLVFGGVHVVAEHVGRDPELGFEVGGGAGRGVAGRPARAGGAAGSGSARAQLLPHMLRWRCANPGLAAGTRARRADRL